MSVVIETTIGDITVDLYLKERPTTCLNFLKLCKIKYYNLCVFHKVERNFIAQTGDPTSTGRGGESVFASLYGDQAKYFEAELKPKLKHEKMGTLSMVNNGNNMNGSQFFITLAENLTYLDEVHTVFGEVAEGFEVLLKLNESICDPNNRPFQDIRITHTVVLHDPYDDPTGLEIPDASPLPTKEMLETDYIAADEEIDDTQGKNVEEIEEKIKESEAKARATILEMVGDIPDADVKPPENVLFVCKLNPVTTSEDLELIFSRFGTIVSCEVIKDKKSGESLQYAFIEFEKEEDCENAYFKMDNVLIDDRRIHVDFSQSVSKLNWEMGKKSGKDKSNRFENLVLKSRDKQSDGYEMIFDNDTESKQSKSNDKKHQSKSSSSKEHSRKHQNKQRSPDSPPRKSHSDNYKYHTTKQFSKDRSHQRYSKSPSFLKSSEKRNSSYSKSPSRHHSSKPSNYESKRKHPNRDTSPHSASTEEEDTLSHKHNRHSPQLKRTKDHSYDKEKYSRSSYYETSKHTSKRKHRNRDRSPHSTSTEEGTPNHKHNRHSPQLKRTKDHSYDKEKHARSSYYETSKPTSNKKHRNRDRSPHSASTEEEDTHSHKHNRHSPQFKRTKTDSYDKEKHKSSSYHETFKHKHLSRKR